MRKGRDRKVKKTIKNMINTLLYLLVVLSMSYGMKMYAVARTDVEGTSMETNLYDGDSLIVDKFTYHFRDPQRFEIIVFPYEDVLFIKRIIGLPGETVQIDEQGNIYIDGEILVEGFGREVIQSNHIGIVSEPLMLGGDEYFVMGDNRNNSTDSRMAMVGNIKRDDIVGRAVFRVWPFSRFGILRY